MKFLDELRADNPEGDMQGVLITPDKPNGITEALLILEETIGYVGDKPICRYYLCDSWMFSYWKSRAYLTACVAIAWNRRVYIHGITKSKKTIEQLAHGKTLLGWQEDGISGLGHRTWEPEDMALKPDAFLEGIDPERDNFGIAAGLQLWLDLAEKGFMNTGIRKPPKEMFQQELAKYTSA